MTNDPRAIAAKHYIALMKARMCTLVQGLKSKDIFNVTDSSIRWYFRVNKSDAVQMVPSNLTSEIEVLIWNFESIPKAYAKSTEPIYLNTLKNKTELNSIMLDIYDIAFHVSNLVKCGRRIEFKAWLYGQSKEWHAFRTEVSQCL